jgi:hypothetical protein
MRQNISLGPRICRLVKGLCGCTCNGESCVGYEESLSGEDAWCETRFKNVLLGYFPRFCFAALRRASESHG